MLEQPGVLLPLGDKAFWGGGGGKGGGSVEGRNYQSQEGGRDSNKPCQ